MAAHNELGKRGEDLAVNHLISIGHLIIARNYRYQKAEIDIISMIGSTIVFTEVKSRHTDKHGYPEMGVSEKKKQLLRDTMEYYLIENKIKEEARFDVIAIVLNDNKADIHHIEDAFYH
jgi:putative endonuclease